MDREIKKSKWTKKRLALLVGVGLVLLAAVFYVWNSQSGKRLKVAREKLRIGRVTRGPFQEFIPVDANVEPKRTILLATGLGGRVEEVFLEEGAIMVKGQAILRLSNPDMVLDFMSRQTQLLDQLNNMRNTRITLDQNDDQLQQQLLDAKKDFYQKERIYKSNKLLHADKAISENDYQQSRFAYEHARDKLRLLEHKVSKDSSYTRQQLQQLDVSTGLVTTNLGMVKQSLDGLTLRAPIAGKLSKLDAEIGQTLAKGAQIGKVDVMKGYKLRAKLDEAYLSRVTVDLPAKMEYAGDSFNLKLAKIYPEVNNGQFEADLYFEGKVPKEIRPGQSFQLRLLLGKLEQALLIPRSGFYQTTGGNWIFVIEGGQAVRRNIKIGRQSPEHYEVLEGLKPGEEVLMDSYASYNDAEILIIE